MTRLELRRYLPFGIRLVVLLALLLLPLPWVADGYTSAVGRLANAALAVVGSGLPVDARFQPPETLRREGSWKGSLRLENRETHRAVRMNVDLRSLSYRSLAMFVALAGATWIRGWRRQAVLWIGGLAAMALWTAVLVSLPLLSAFSAAGALGAWPGFLARTAYQALATPAMVFLVPALVWAGLIVATRSVAPSSRIRSSFVACTPDVIAVPGAAVGRAAQRL